MSLRVAFIDTVHQALEERLTEAGMQCDDLTKVSADDLPEKLAPYQGIVIRSRVRVDAALLRNAPNLKFVARSGAGLENIDLDYCEQRGIKCYNSPEGNRDAVAEHAIGMLLALMNHVCRGNSEVRNGEWDRENNRGTELGFKTVGIIGLGNMGTAFAQRLQGFGVKTIAYDKYHKGHAAAYVEEVELERIFTHSDVVSLHVPFTSETDHLVNAEFLSKFKKPIWLINTARGAIVDTASLLDAIDAGKVRGACLDVLEFEKSSFGSIDRDPTLDRLMQNGKVLLTPHVAGWTHASYKKLSTVLADKILSDLRAGEL